MIIADTTPLSERLMGGMLVIVGLVVLRVGIQNVRTKTAEETGDRRMINRLLGRSNSYTGWFAVMTGVVRTVAALIVIIAGILFMIFGPFLKQLLG